MPIVTITVTLLLLVLFLLFIQGASGKSVTVFDQKTYESRTPITSAVTYIQEKYHSGSIREVVNILDIHLLDSNTKLELGIPNPLNALMTTTRLAQKNSSNDHIVVGAVNAAYFLSNGFPANLIAENNQLIHFGILGERVESPTQQPIAFGISKTGQAIIGDHSAKLSFRLNGKKYSIDTMNVESSANKTVLYTPFQKTTGTNEYGVEIVVTNASQNTKEWHFGDRCTGTISEVTKYHHQGNSDIPEDGFVISIQNAELASGFNPLLVGCHIEVELSIDAKWQDAQLILGAGPLLVKEGEVRISMPTNSSFVKSRQPRTAVAVDSTGKRVFLVTVDGRKRGYSTGTDLHDLALYLISKGAHMAMNLDGGGSTSMAVLQSGDLYPILVNRPSEGSERRGSVILQVVSTQST